MDRIDGRIEIDECSRRHIEIRREGYVDRVMRTYQRVGDGIGIIKWISYRNIRFDIPENDQKC